MKMSNRKGIFSNILILCVLGSFWKSCCGNVIDVDVKSLQDLPLKLFDDEVKSFVFNFNSSLTKDTAVRFTVDKTNIASIFENDTFLLSENITVWISGHLLGRANLTVLFVNTSSSSSTGDNPDSNTLYEVPTKFGIIVSRKEKPIDTAFTVVIIILVIVLNIGMGCKVELSVVKETLKKPIAPITGFLSQFILMPVISFLLAYFLKLDPGIALGFFAVGCSPGGSASNIYSYLLGGDVSLSVTMTLISTVASLGMIPLWLFTLGTKVLYKDAGLEIPFTNIFTSLVGLILPIGIGLFLKHKKPEWAKQVVKIIRPFTFIFLLFVFTVGVYANLYIFYVLVPMVILAGALLPYCGFLFGGIVAFITRQSKKNIITIAIETGIQNTGIAIVMLKVSLEPPDNDLGIVPAIISAIFTPIPLVIAIVALEIKKRCLRKKTLQLQHAEDNGEMLQDHETTPKKTENDKDLPKIDLTGDH